MSSSSSSSGTIFNILDGKGDASSGVGAGRQPARGQQRQRKQWLVIWRCLGGLLWAACVSSQGLLVRLKLGLTCYGEYEAGLKSKRKRSKRKKPAGES